MCGTIVTRRRAMAAKATCRGGGDPCDNAGVFTAVFDRIVAALAEACREVYGDRLVGVVVFGSVGRGLMRPDSDVDVLVVAEPLPSGRGARMEEFEQVEARLAPVVDAARREGVTTWISPLVRTLEELDRSGFIVFDIACDGRVVYDPTGRMGAYLAGVRERLAARGARRRSASRSSGAGFAGRR
ncbi:MAG: hypothetical protein C4344_03200, partial [Acidimicrobiia bacterium]